MDTLIEMILDGRLTLILVLVIGILVAYAFDVS